MSESERSAEEIKTELIPKLETGEGTPATLEFAPPALPDSVTPALNGSASASAPPTSPSSNPMGSTVPPPGQPTTPTPSQPTTPTPGQPPATDQPAESAADQPTAPAPGRGAPLPDRRPPPRWTSPAAGAAPLPDPPASPAKSAFASSTPAAPDPVDIPTGPMPVVERGLLTGAMPLYESGVPAEPVIPRTPFIPPELLARRQPAPHSAALALQSLQQAPPGVQPPATGAISIGQQPPPATSPRGRRGLSLVLIGVAGVLVVAVVVAVVLTFGKPQHKARTPTVTATTAPALQTLNPTVTSYTTNGSGFEQDGQDYRTQTYRTAEFGKLKPGVGLVLDLGAARDVTSIEFTAGDGPLTVELRSADQQPTSLAGYTKVGASMSADGSTKLDASTGGKHQYWLIWVTQLGSHSGGYAAEIGDITVRAKALS